MLRLLAALPAVVATLILRTDRRLVASLRNAGALAASSAIVVTPHNALVRWRLGRLHRVGAFGRNPTGQFYLDERGWDAWRRVRRRRMLVALAVVVPVALVAFAIRSR